MYCGLPISRSLRRLHYVVIHSQAHTHPTLHHTHIRSPHTHTRLNLPSLLHPTHPTHTLFHPTFPHTPTHPHHSPHVRGWVLLVGLVGRQLSGPLVTPSIPGNHRCADVLMTDRFLAVKIGRVLCGGERGEKSEYTSYYDDIIIIMCVWGKCDMCWLV